ncbi:hypothetical protein COBT_001202 [Conglomerata obtusa]
MIKARRDKNFHLYAEKHIQKGKISNKTIYDIGDHVMVFRGHDSEKLKSKWLDGFTIKKKLHDNAYLVEKNLKTYRVNKNHLQKALKEEGECRR